MIHIQNYNDGTTREAGPCGPSDHNGYIVNTNALPLDTAFKFTTPGLYPISVNCEGVTYEYQILVSPEETTGDATFNSIVTYAHNASYCVGEEFEENSIVVLGIMSDGSSKIIQPSLDEGIDGGFVLGTSELHLDGDNKFTTAGTFFAMVVVVETDGNILVDIFPVTVYDTEEAVLVGLNFEGQNTNFVVGEAFEIGDIIVNGIYSDGTTNTIEAFVAGVGGYKVNTNGLPLDIDGKFTASGIYFVEIMVGDLCVSYPIYVGQ